MPLEVMEMLSPPSPLQVSSGAAESVVVKLSVAGAAQCDQVLLAVISQLAVRFEVMHFDALD